MKNLNDISIATEILAMKFSKSMFNKDELKILLKEKDLVASGDKETIWYLDKSEDFPSVEEAVSAIKNSGGLVFLPHIYIYKWMKDIHQELEELVNNYDIDGIECYHSDFSEENIKEINEYCDKNNLFKSGGSDYHGANKHHISLAIGRGNLKIPTDIVKAWHKE